MKRCRCKEQSSYHSFQLNDVLIIQNLFAFVCGSPQRGVWKTGKTGFRIPAFAYPSIHSIGIQATRPVSYFSSMCFCNHFHFDFLVF